MLRSLNQPVLPRHDHNGATMFYEELKGVSIADMEAAIGKAISDLVGSNFTCNISNIDLSSIHSAKMEIFLAPPNEFDTVGPDDNVASVLASVD
jgi:hypothetical protein